MLDSLGGPDSRTLTPLQETYELTTTPDKNGNGGGGGGSYDKTIPPEIIGTKTNADLLRAALSRYPSGLYKEKSGQLSDSGNDITVGAKYAAETFLSKLYAAYPSYSITFTAGNDAWHVENSPGSTHTIGRAFDIAISGVENRVSPAKYKKVNGKKIRTKNASANPNSYTAEEKTKIDNIIRLMKESGFTYVLDEYRYPSKWATGGHIHFDVR